MQGITKDNAFGVDRLASTRTARVCDSSSASDVSDIVDDGACRRRRGCRWCWQCTCCTSCRGRQRRQLFIDTRDILASAQAVAARLFAVAADLAPAAQRAGAVAVSTEYGRTSVGSQGSTPSLLLSQTYTAGLLRRRTSGSGMVFWVFWGPIGKAVELVAWCLVWVCCCWWCGGLGYRRVTGV